MRIASYDQFNRAQSYINNIQRTLSDKQLQLSTGKQFNKASEAPVKAKQSEVLNQAMMRIQQYEKNVSDAKGILETSVTVLQNAYKVLENVNNEALKASTQIYTPSDRQTIAMVVDKAIEQLVSIGNTKHLNRFIFSGEKIQTKPFDYDGTTVTYNGNSNDINFEVSSYVQLKVIGGGDTYLKKSIEDLIKIRDQILAGDQAGLTLSLTENAKNMDNVINQVADMGVKIDGLNNIQASFEEQKINLETRRSDTEDIDFTKVMVEYSVSQMTYQASMKATTMMFQTSIMDYI